MSASAQRKLSQAHQHLANGNAPAAARLCEEVLSRAPRNPDALWMRGAPRLMAGDANEAASQLERAVAAAAAHGAALEQLGVAHFMRGDHAAAVRALTSAAAIPGAPPSVLMRLGHAQGTLGKWVEARQAFEAVLRRLPEDPDTLYNLGVVDMSRGEAALACAWLERALSRAPAHMEARERLAAAYLALGRYPQAAAELERVIEAQPANADAIEALAEAVFQKGDTDRALDLARRALELDAKRAGPYILSAQIHHVRGDLDLAAASLEAGYASTGDDLALATLVHVAHRQCDFEKWSPLWAQMKARLPTSSRLGSPLWLLPEDTTPAEQLDYTQRWVATSYPPAVAGPARRRRAPDERVRIGYFSGDFHQHPVPCLAVETFELHDRERFEVFAYSYGPDDGSAMRARLAGAFEHFVDVAWDPDDAVEKRIREDDLDILIDIKGYTAGDRLAVMAKRPCAVQVEWLGYPGPMGAPFIDYVIADENIIPASDERYYSERVLRMPHCYQANDRKRAAPEPRTRAEYGLPDDAFVLCCFNQSVKITPPIYERWLSLLRALPGSVLWLLDDNRWASANLIAYAESRGVSR
jgi:predicted O-linked N-acetylglucosamine transferase (SPINDLY family)